MHSQLTTERELTLTKRILVDPFFAVFIRQFNLDSLINQYFSDTISVEMSSFLPSTLCFQILALRLLQAVLPSWDKTERSQDMKFLVEKLFGFLGSLLSTCSSDLPLLRGAAMVQA